MALCDPSSSSTLGRYVPPAHPSVCVWKFVKAYALRSVKALRRQFASLCHVWLLCQHAVSAAASAAAVPRRFQWALLARTSNAKIESDQETLLLFAGWRNDGFDMANSDLLGKTRLHYCQSPSSPSSPQTCTFVCTSALPRAPDGALQLALLPLSTGMFAGARMRRAFFVVSSQRNLFASQSRAPGRQRQAKIVAVRVCFRALDLHRSALVPSSEPFGFSFASGSRSPTTVAAFGTASRSSALPLFRRFGGADVSGFHRRPQLVSVLHGGAGQQQSFWAHVTPSIPVQVLTACVTDFSGENDWLEP